MHKLIKNFHKYCSAIQIPITCKRCPVVTKKRRTDNDKDF